MSATPSKPPQADEDRAPGRPGRLYRAGTGILGRLLRLPPVRGSREVAEAYSAAGTCEAGDARYVSRLAYAVEAGRVKSLEWSSVVMPSGHGCRITGARQEPMQGGLKLASGGGCTVTLREVGENVKVAAENCSAACGSEAYFEPLLVDRRGQCTLLRPQAR